MVDEVKRGLGVFRPSEQRLGDESPESQGAKDTKTQDAKDTESQDAKAPKVKIGVYLERETWERLEQALLDRRLAGESTNRSELVEQALLAWLGG